MIVKENGETPLVLFLSISLERLHFSSVKQIMAIKQRLK